MNFETAFIFGDYFMYYINLVDIIIKCLLIYGQNNNYVVYY